MLSDKSRQIGLKMNIKQTNERVVDNTPINVNNVLIENVNDDCRFMWMTFFFLLVNIH